MTDSSNITKENHRPIETDEITLKDLILKVKIFYNYLISKWLIIVITSLIGGALGYIYASKQKFNYTAATTFVLEEESSKGGGLGQYAGLASMVGLDLGGGGGGIFQGENILELYKSRKMIESTLLTKFKLNGSDRLLIDQYIQMNDLRMTWDKRPDLKNIQFKNFADSNATRIQDSLLGVFALDIKNNLLSISKPDKKLSIIDVEVKSKDEIFSKVFNETIVKNVNDFYIKTKTKKSLFNLSILQRQTDSVRNALHGAIVATAAITDATPNLNITRQVLRAPGQRSQINAEANKAILSQLVQNLELSKIALRNETPLIQVIDGPRFPLQKSKVGYVKGVTVGIFLAGAFTVFILLVKKIIKSIME
ncbi:lipopolysaccharide biosynthesis protein [Pedobacter sp. MC2016-15]|uniref:lipopolysaccharide biosynthesis protein n=1 Tax=Pedobacter sp. MC2016-15 TaxID=2994473 RepID=UPI00224612F5|nr:lipopolysaccharide biosynthesis protein [Pedobacter sp. MC2016-15]MCX2481794.1 lipopolysaccharide biosynthesis protein [Pedobacter sp. MC2016-15]